MFAAYRNYWDFHGRAARAEYWLFLLFNFLVGIVAGLVDAFAFPGEGVPGLLGPTSLIVIFANLIPNLSLTFRRLHDTNRTAWWVLIGAIPILGGLLLFIFSLLPGTRGENRFGPAPGGRSSEELATTFA
jgi:uncharacterized membrane protein YhaH (DUF805 family)